LPASPLLRDQPQLAGPVASDPVVSRLVSMLAQDGSRVLKAIRAARVAARERAWALAGDSAPGADGKLVTVVLDARYGCPICERLSYCEVVRLLLPLMVAGPGRQ
jgi:hypothetical protein